MVPTDESNTSAVPISSFLQAIGSLSVLSERQIHQIEEKVTVGEFPADAAELATRLVKEGLLTDYQSRQLVKGKGDSLVFGRYLILDYLGKGTMGKVYKAVHRMMGRTVALKILDARFLSNTRTLARFQREMQLVGRLDHPNVIRAFDADRIADCHFIAMEFADGLTLQDLMKERGALPPAEAVFYAYQAAEGLAHAHARGVLHRDVKPSNLMLTEGRKLKILDFGLGMLLEKEDMPAQLTAAGITVGTPDYISPEQARMLKLDGRSDLYSLGCSIYHLLSGQLPFKGESSMDCIVGRITGQAVPISSVRPGLPSRLIQTIEKMMATNPDDRYQTADEAAAALKSLLRPKNAPAGQSVRSGDDLVSAGEPVAKESANVAKPVPKESVNLTKPVPKESVNLAKPVPKEGTSAATPAPKEGRILADLAADERTPAATPLPRIRAGATPAKPKAKGGLLSGLDDQKKALAIFAVAAVAAIALVTITVMLLSLSGGKRPADAPATASSSGDEVPAPEAPAASAPEVERPAARTAKAPTPTAPIAAAAARQPVLVIESPAQGATVGMHEELSGRIESEGWPVIFVQADIPGQPWWCQAAVERVDGGRFTARVVFGDDLTPSGTKFRVAGIVTRSREDAQKFNIGSKEQALPEGYPRSAEVLVTHR
jgi:serine/threonine-protein kinase